MSFSPANVEDIDENESRPVIFSFLHWMHEPELVQKILRSAVDVRHYPVQNPLQGTRAVPGVPLQVYRFQRVPLGDALIQERQRVVAQVQLQQERPSSE